jgi:hypothetical protein
MTNDLPLWVIYDHPTDHPQFYVARKWLVGRGKYEATGDIRVGITLDEVRRKIGPGKARLDRHVTDDPKIIEVWI